MNDPGSLDILQYRIFKWVLFLFFLAALLRLVNTELHITQLLSRIH